MLFLDEPTTGLDAEGRQETWELVRELRETGTTVVLTTHYLEEAEGLADRLAILHAGRIAVSGTPAEVTASQPSRISFELPAGYFPGDLPPLASLGITGHEMDGPDTPAATLNSSGPPPGSSCGPSGRGSSCGGSTCGRGRWRRRSCG